MESLQQDKTTVCQDKYQPEMQQKVIRSPQVAGEPEQLNSGEVQNSREQEKPVEKLMAKLEEKENPLHDGQEQLLQHEQTKFLEGQSEHLQQQQDSNLHSLWNKISKWENIIEDRDAETESVEEEDHDTRVSRGLESDLGSDLESGLESETTEVISHQLEKLKEAHENLWIEVEVLLKETKEFKRCLQQQLLGKLAVFVTLDNNMFIGLKDPQQRQSWRPWDGDIETLQQHLSVWESTFAYEEREKVGQLDLSPVDEVTWDDEEDKEEKVEEEEEEIGECEEDGSEMEFGVPQSHQSSASLQSLSSDESSSSSDTSFSDTDASPPRPLEKKNQFKAWFKKIFGVKERRSPAARSNKEESEPSVNRMEPVLEKDCSEEEEKKEEEEEAEEDLNKLYRHHYYTRSRKMEEAISKCAAEPQTCLHVPAQQPSLSIETDRSVSGSSVSETTAESEDAGCFCWFLCGRSWRKNKKKLKSWFRKRFARKAARAPERDPAHSLRDKITLGLTPSGSGKRSKNSFVKERP